MKTDFLGKIGQLFRKKGQFRKKSANRFGTRVDKQLAAAAKENEMLEAV